MTTPLIEIDAVGMSFSGSSGDELHVLDSIDLDLADGEIVAILGRSGSGKSTLLRTIAGLIAPTSGTVRYRGEPLVGANAGTAMVFQSFALMPWLTVIDNVELGLVARGVPRIERRRRAMEMIDVIGLDGFESAYPKELSGGMRQRVGFARALVLEPDVLLMDEPFSALDVLTAENLRTELVDLWENVRFPTRSMCIVTHNIEEAVLLADRVVVLGAHPGRIIGDIDVTSPRPRDRTAVDFTTHVDRIYRLLTGTPESKTAAAVSATPTSRPLPAATVGGIAGLVELVHSTGPTATSNLASILTFDIDDLFPVIDAAQMLGLLDVQSGVVETTKLGAMFTSVGIQDKKVIFARQIRSFAPLVTSVVAALEATDDGELSSQLFADLLRRGFGPEAARSQLETAIDWGRYGELFDYDADSETISLA
ncbi:MAG: nitrate/sulfonate/bicarbonate ABC transporter ATP-binding protein [Corynebacteriales bacterium]|uniref:Nitrate/sulfonate/bicarbonate ABC transporter ATP-binding protein n=1 Tax=Williamsia herbipolensis TaxID=1603258 RepID=A0AAU4JZ48_9NOCA|nr:nitrate/sulfonate/bicarbonate ABC transporter ATP-binding protein [Williamsia herbipolensis]MCX6471930.1 nitrate/sulfonate/bicarbonate ABC transporter ATP-binding protein [Mycobacteriales bacterium]